MTDTTKAAEREAFQAYAATEKYHAYDFTLFAGEMVKGRTYLDMTTELSFRSWQARAAQAVQVPQWISVKDQIPEDEALYLALERGGDYDVVYETVIQDNPDAYTHWMRIPAAPPKETPNDRDRP
jgi:hypothetical protein